MNNHTIHFRLFKKLSLILTGFENFNEKTIIKFFLKFKKEYSIEFNNLLLQFEEYLKNSTSDNEAVSKLMNQSETSLNLIRNIIILWYTGEFNKKDKTTILEAQDHYNALLWEVTHSHPPGLSGGYFGYWKYKPEN